MNFRIYHFDLFELRNAYGYEMKVSYLPNFLTTISLASCSIEEPLRMYFL